MNTLVTGGGGFVGRRIVELLLEQGHSVSILARGRYPEVEALGATGIQADLSDPEAVAAAAEGMDAVFHVAARFGFNGDRGAFWATNVLGTQHVIDACVRHSVSKLVFTSRPSLIRGWSATTRW